MYTHTTSSTSVPHPCASTREDEVSEAVRDAGCEAEVVLGHLRAHADHTANCRALRLLTEQT